ncbi:MAG: DUF3604 domain-containing protein [Candidatus Lokiarchaeota archaeon]
MFAYTLILFIVEILKRKSQLYIQKTSNLFSKFNRYTNKQKNVIKAIILFIPIISWTWINVDFEVMFDNNPQMLWVHIPSKVEVGESFDITVEVWDQFERLSAVYKGSVAFSIVSYNLSTLNEINSDKIQANLPKDYTFSGQIFDSDMAYNIKDGKDNGIKRFHAWIATPGIHYILVRDSYTKNTYYSNPLIVKEFSENEKNIYWGDLHTHSDLSDGSGTAEHCFNYAQNVAQLDYYALTDHGEIMLFNPTSFNHLESATNDAYQPGSFVTFHGIEWTQVSTGHYICIFSGNKLLKSPIVSYLTIPTINGLWNALDEFTSKTGCSALALPHHTTKKSYIQDWTYINPKYVKIAEVTSVHGEFLFEQRNELNYRGAIDAPPTYTYGSSINDAFTMGYRMTLYASSDGHDGHPGHSLSHTRAYIGHQRPFSLWHTRNEHPYTGGLTAVYSDNLTRDGVFNGLQNQRIYASADHGRPILTFMINSTKVGDGSTFVASNQYSHRELNIFLAQDGAPVALDYHAAKVTPNWIPNWKASIEIIKNGKFWDTININSPIQNITIIDKEPISGTSFESNCIFKNGKWYINSYSDNPIDPTSLNTNGFDYYLVRVIGDNGRTSYIGPIWVEY